MTDPQSDGRHEPPTPIPSTPPLQRDPVDGEPSDVDVQAERPPDEDGESN